MTSIYLTTSCSSCTKGRVHFREWREGTLCDACRWEKRKADDRAWIGRYMAAKWPDLKAEDLGSLSIRERFHWCKVHGDSTPEGLSSSVTDATCGCASKHVQINSMHFGVVVKGRIVGAGCATSRDRFDGKKDGEKVPVTMDPRHVSCRNCVSRIASVLKEAGA